MGNKFFLPPPVQLSQALRSDVESGGGINRRRFIKRAGGATAATFVAWNLASQKARAADTITPSGSWWGKQTGLTGSPHDDHYQTTVGGRDVYVVLAVACDTYVDGVKWRTRTSIVTATTSVIDVANGTIYGTVDATYSLKGSADPDNPQIDLSWPNATGLKQKAVNVNGGSITIFANVTRGSFSSGGSSVFSNFTASGCTAGNPLQQDVSIAHSATR